MPVGLATVVVATIGVLAAARLGTMVAHLLLLSTGMLAAAIAAGGATMLAAMLYYLPHTTLVSAALFLLVGRIAAARGSAADRIVHAVAVTGLPPLSGFLGKLMLLTAAPAGMAGGAMWVIFILSGFVSALAMARAASTVFWEKADRPEDAAPHTQPAAAVALVLAIGLVPLLVVAAAPLSAHARATAEQLVARRAYLEAVFPPGAAAVARERRP
jgi:multicomponent K+:H+ antiporter subunit D